MRSGRPGDPRRILMLITSLIQGGGAESQVVRLSMELRSRGYHVTVVSLVQPAAHVDELEQADIQVHSLGMKPGVPDFRAVLALRNIIRDFRPDVVHCHMFHANLLGRITRLFCPIPVLICTAHSVRENSREGGPSWHREMLYRATDRIADRTTTICHAGYTRYVRVGAASPKKFSVVANGIDTNRFSRCRERRSKVRRELGLQDTFAWLAVGRLVVQKDYPTLLRALELIGQENLTLLIAGSGPLEGALRQECVDRHLERRVRFCGERKDMLDLYNAADGFVMSSQTEGLPMAALEAAAMGLPCVVTNVGGIPEVVIDGIAGHVVPSRNPSLLASALEGVMHASPEVREIMGRAARQHCRDNYGMERIVQQWLDLYSECYSSAQAREHTMPTNAYEISGIDLAQPSTSFPAPGNRSSDRNPPPPSALVISLDFELYWGVRDRRPLSRAECSRLLAARTAVPRILDLFEEFSVSATWATVGLLFARSRDEAQAFAPHRKPNYVDTRLQAFREQVGKDEREDPFHFAPSLIADIARRKGQEIGSHSFSHFYCMESGQNAGDFEADIQSAVAIAANSGYDTKSYVFARNQVNPAYLPLLKQAGITAYRANEATAIKKAANDKEQRRVDYRLRRLLDAYVDICGPQISPWPEGPRPLALPASRYLRPYNPKVAMLEPILLQRIAQAMKTAVLRGEVFHLWLHPEDFAPFVEENLCLLRRVLQVFEGHRRECGMVSLSMGQLSGAVPFQE